MLNVQRGVGSFHQRAESGFLQQSSLPQRSLNAFAQCPFGVTQKTRGNLFAAHFQQQRQ